MKLLITNTVTLNAGVAAMVIAMQGMFRREFGEDAEILVFDDRADAAAKYYPALRYRRLLHAGLTRLRHWPGVGPLLARLNVGRFRLAVRLRARGRRRLARLLLRRYEAEDLEHYAGADLVVSAGGTYLVENYDLASRLFDFEVALALGRPLVLFTQTMGPFRDPKTRAALLPLLERARLILLRDEASLRHVRELGAKNPAVQVCGDAVFALARTEPPAARPRRSRPRVAISVRHWPYFKSTPEREGMQRYSRAIADAATHLVRAHGAAVTFVSTCQGIPEYWMDDGATAAQIGDLIAPEVRASVTVDRAFRTPEQMLTLLAEFDLVVATRFHFAVLSLMAHVPAVAIGYELQTRELYERMDLADWVHEIEAMDSADFLARLERCLADAPRVRESLRAPLARERELAFRAAALVRESIAAPPHAPRPEVRQASRAADLAPEAVGVGGGG